MRLTQREYKPALLHWFFMTPMIDVQTFMAHSLQDLAKLKHNCLDASIHIFVHLDFHPQDPPLEDIQCLWHMNETSSEGKTLLSSMANNVGAAILVHQLTVTYHLLLTTIPVGSVFNS